MRTTFDLREFLRQEDDSCFPWERKSAEEVAARKLREPATNLGEGRIRFSLLLSRLKSALDSRASIADFGAYPGTFLRIARFLGDGPLAACGFGFDDRFRGAMDALSVRMVEAEFDVRACNSHILNVEPVGLDAAVCTEVVEHQMYPLSLLVGINRHLKCGGRLYLTTNSVSFVGDVLKLCAGQHWEPLGRSHVLCDSAWRPHVRLYTLNELVTLLRMTGFEPDEAFYFDNGNPYRGIKGIAVSAVRSLASVVPHMRSHIFLASIKKAEPTLESLTVLHNNLSAYGLADRISVMRAESVGPLRAGS